MAETSFFKNIPGIFSRKGSRPNNSLPIFLTFVGIATFIWFLWTLEKEYTTVVSNPVEFTGLPQDRVLVNKLPAKIQMEVTGRGFALLRHNWDIKKSRVKISFRNLYGESAEKLTANSIPLSLNTVPVRSSLSNQLPNLRVNNVIPDTLSIRFANMISKKVPVAAQLEIETEKQYMASGTVRIIPDSIEIRGPSTILDTISQLNTSPLVMKKVKGNITRSLSIQPVHEKVSYSKNRVQVEVPVEQYTEKSIEVPIAVVNVPDSLHLKIFPTTAALIFRVAVSRFNTVQSENFSLTVDYNQVLEGSPSKLLVRLESHPDFIKNIKVNPESVSYILETK